MVDKLTIIMEFGALCVVRFLPCTPLFCLMSIFFLKFIYSNMHLDFPTGENIIFLFIVFFRHWIIATHKVLCIEM